MSLCWHAVVGGLLVSDGKIAMARRQKEPLDIAPSAGHVDPEDGLLVPLRWDGDDPAFRRACAREITEETGVEVSTGDLQHVLTYPANDSCRRVAADGPGGKHLWRVYTVEFRRRPTLLDAPGEMLGWDWADPREAMFDDEVEPIWRTLLGHIF